MKSSGTTINATHSSFLRDNLLCPALEEATFFYENEEDERDCRFLFSFLEGRGQTLLKLGLPGMAIDSDYRFQRVLVHLEVLEELTITGPLGWPDNLERDGNPDSRVCDAGTYSFFNGLKKQPRSLPNLKILRMLEQRTEEKIYVERELQGFSTAYRHPQIEPGRQRRAEGAKAEI